MWLIILQFLFYIGVSQVNAVIEYNVTNDFRDIFPYKVEPDGKNYYQIEKDALHSIDVTRHFILGDLFHSFECTFRLDPEKIDKHTNFSLIHLYNAKKTFHLSINFVLKDNLIKITFRKDAAKTIYNFHFNKTVDFLDGEWHNIMYGFHNFKHEATSLDCWIDCTKQSYHNIKRETFSHIHNPYHSIHNVTLSIAELHNTKTSESIPIKISKMRFHGYSNMPVFAKCEDIRKTAKSKEPQEVKFTKVHIYNYKNRSEYNYDSDESGTTEDSFESMSDSISTSIEDYSDHDEKISPVSSILGFLLFCAFIAVTAFLLKKYY